MRSADEFAGTIRAGARAGRSTLVVHCRVVPGREAAKVGFVVARSVGGAVTRNRVRRRLRGMVVDHRDSLPHGADVVVRALPSSAAAGFADLEREYRSALDAACRRALARVAQP